MALTKIESDGVKNDAITGTHIAAGVVGSTELMNNGVITNKIADDAVTSAKIADNAVLTAGIADGAVTAAKMGTLGSNSVGTTQLVDQNVTLDKLPHGTSSNDGKFLRANNGADPSFETVSIPAGVGGANGVDFNDEIKTRYGNSNDLEIWHSSNSNTYIKNNTGELKLASDNIALMTTDQSEKFIDCNGNGNVELYHDNTKQCETSSVGLKFPSGKGIDFSPTGNGTGSNQNELFDDYETGTWAPSLNVGSVSVADGGTYVKCGKLCHLTVLLSSWSNTSSSSSILIYGVPFNSSAQAVGTVWLRRTNSGDKGWVCTIGDSGNNIINIQRHSNGNDMGQALTYDAFAHSSPYMNITITYQTS